MLRCYLLADLGDTPTTKATSAELFTVIKSIDGNGDTRERVASFSERIFAMTEVLGIPDNNPMTSLKLNLPAKSDSKRSCRHY